MQINIHSHHPFDASLTILNRGTELGEHTPFSYGIHPWFADKPFDSTNLEQRLSQTSCLAVGEIGLDKLTDVEFKIQEKIFVQQIQLAEKWELPVILHLVKSWNEALAIKKELNPKQAWIFHGFRKRNLLESVLKNDLYISIGTAVLSDTSMLDWLSEIPNNRLFLETDTQSPEKISEVYRIVAERKKLSLPALEAQIETNFKTVFKRWQIG